MCPGRRGTKRKAEEEKPSEEETGDREQGDGGHSGRRVVIEHWWAGS